MTETITIVAAIIFFASFSLMGWFIGKALDEYKKRQLIKSNFWLSCLNTCLLAVLIAMFAFYIMD